MFINYEHENHVYNVIIERKEKYYYITYDNTEYKVEAEENKSGQIKIKIGNRLIKAIITEGEKEKYIFINGEVYKVKPIQLTGTKKIQKKDEEDLFSPISGKVINVKIKKGDIVKKGDILMVIEAMKMEYLIRAPFDGRIVNILFKEKDQIEIGQNTVEISKSEDK
jgi:3-methylcrotonyl-CoA carboxylase alpha subunit